MGKVRNFYNGKKLIDIRLGFWDNVRKYNGKKLMEIKLGFLDNVMIFYSME